MQLLAHASTKVPNTWDWGQPLGMVAFAVGVALTLLLLAMAIKTLASIDPDQKKRK